MISLEAARGVTQAQGHATHSTLKLTLVARCEDAHGGPCTAPAPRLCAHNRSWIALGQPSPTSRSRAQAVCVTRAFVRRQRTKRSRRGRNARMYHILNFLGAVTRQAGTKRARARCRWLVTCAAATGSRLKHRVAQADCVTVAHAGAGGAAPQAALEAGLQVAESDCASG